MSSLIPPKNLRVKNSWYSSAVERALAFKSVWFSRCNTHAVDPHIQQVIPGTGRKKHLPQAIKSSSRKSMRPQLEFFMQEPCLEMQCICKLVVRQVSPPTRPCIANTKPLQTTSIRRGSRCHHSDPGGGRRKHVCATSHEG